jgi:CHAD domain-containing protein
LDVLSVLINELQADPTYPAAALVKVREAVEQARVAAWKRLRIKLPSRKLVALAESLQPTSEQFGAGRAGFKRKNGPPRAWLWALHARLVVRAAKVRSAIDMGGTVYHSQRLHDVRIALKKLRYATELAKETGRRGASADVAVMKGAQDLLGRLHDLEILLGWSREMQTSAPSPDITTWREFGSLVRAIEEDCHRLHAGYVSGRAALIAIAERLQDGGGTLATGGRRRVG